MRSGSVVLNSSSYARSFTFSFQSAGLECIWDIQVQATFLLCVTNATWRNCGVVLLKRMTYTAWQIPSAYTAGYLRFPVSWLAGLSGHGAPGGSGQTSEQHQRAEALLPGAGQQCTWDDWVGEEAVLIPGTLPQNGRCPHDRASPQPGCKLQGRLTAWLALLGAEPGDRAMLGESHLSMGAYCWSILEVLYQETHFYNFVLFILSYNKAKSFNKRFKYFVYLFLLRIDFVLYFKYSILISLFLYIYKTACWIVFFFLLLCLYLEKWCY